MGRRKTSNRKKTSKKNVKNFSNDLHGGIVVVIGLMLFVFLVFKNTGVISEFLNNIARGLFGNIALMLPLVLIFVGIHEIAAEEKIKTYKEIYKGIVLIGLLCSIIYSFTLNNPSLFENPVKFIVDSYNAGVDGINISGLIGAIIARFQ